MVKGHMDMDIQKTTPKEGKGKGNIQRRQNEISRFIPFISLSPYTFHLPLIRCDVRYASLQVLKNLAKRQVGMHLFMPILTQVKSIYILYIVAHSTYFPFLHFPFLSGNPQGNGTYFILYSHPPIPNPFGQSLLDILCKDTRSSPSHHRCVWSQNHTRND